MGTFGVVACTRTNFWLDIENLNSRDGKNETFWCVRLEIGRPSLLESERQGNNLWKNSLLKSFCFTWLSSLFRTPRSSKNQPAIWTHSLHKVWVPQRQLSLIQHVTSPSTTASLGSGTAGDKNFRHDVINNIKSLFPMHFVRYIEAEEKSLKK